MTLCNKPLLADELEESVQRMSLPVVMSIAGADCSAGAGIQADLKTFQSLGVMGTTAITCVVAESPNVVRRIQPLPVDFLEEQILLLLDEFPISAIKLGMLYSAEHIEVISRILKSHLSIPLVIDPIFSASTGATLCLDDALAAYQSLLFPLATVITPNLPEARMILQDDCTASFDSLEGVCAAAAEIAKRYDCAVLLKGGHFSCQQSSTDVLAAADQITLLKGTRLQALASHGTGCTLSAAIAAELAKGSNIAEACRIAKTFVRHAMMSGQTWRGSQGNFVSLLNPRPLNTTSKLEDYTNV